MKIAFVYDVLYPETIGGVEKRIFEIGTRLAQRGHEIHLFPMSSGTEKNIFVRDGLIIHPVCRPMGLYTNGRRSVMQALWYSLHLVPVLLRVKVDIIDCQNFPYFPVIISRFIGFMKRERCVITWHEAWGEYWYQYLGWAGIGGRVIEKTALLLSRYSVAVSRHTADRMRKEGFRGRMVIVPNGINLQEIQAIRPNERSADIIFIGRFIPEKHPELVIEAVKILVRDFPDLTCIMIGDGPLMARLAEMIHEHNLTEHIHLPGFISTYHEVIRTMKSARVFVLPSEREGFGIVCIEAMACGLPVITTDYPLNAASDHVLPGCGYCAEPNADDIASGIRTFLSQSPDKSVLDEYVIQHDWEQITSALEEVYGSLLCEHFKDQQIYT